MNFRKLYFMSAIIFGLANVGYSQLFTTTLKVTIRNELGNIEEGAEVVLFATEEDYRKETNPATEIGYTNKRGNVKFKELEPKVYFVSAVKDDKNNVGAGVETQPLEEGKINTVTIIIE